MTPTDATPPPDPERLPHLTDAQIDLIADRAVTKAFDKIYAEVGKSVLRKLAWLLGMAVVGGALWLAGKDALPK